MICTSALYGVIIIALAIISLVALMSVLYLKKQLYLNRMISGIFIVIVMFVTYLYGISYKKVPTINSYIDSNNGIECKLKGVVSDINNKETYIQLLIKEADITINTSNDTTNTIKNITVLANTSENLIKKGDVVNVIGVIKTFDSARNEGNFDSLTYYRSIGIDYKVSVKSIEVIKNTRSELMKKLDTIKARQRVVYTSIADSDDAGVFISMVLGDKSILGTDIKEMYQKNGISHLLAISGLHISLIGMTIYSILRKLRQSFITSSVVAGFIIVCYGIMTGNAISTTRAVIMLIISLGAQVFGRAYDIITSLSVSAIILIYDNPYVISNSAFQLSFGAVLGIAVVYPSLKYILNNIIKNQKLDNDVNILIIYISKKVCIVVDALLISISVNIVTIPIVMFNYFEFPPYSIILNLIVVPFMSLLMICAVVAGIVGMVSLNVATFIIGISHYILKIYNILCTYMQKLPHSLIVTGKPEIKNIIIYYVITIIFIIIVNAIKYIQQNDDINKEFSIIKDRFSYLFQYKFLCAMLVVGFAILISRQKANFEIDMLDVGQGDCIFMQTENNKTYLFDGGSTDINEVGKYRIMPFLKSRKITTLDCIMISHSDADHINAIVELIDMTCDTFSIKKIVLPDIKAKLSDKAYCELVEKATKQGIDVEYISAGDIIFNGNIVKEINDINKLKANNKDTIIECIHPTPQYDYSCANDYSAVYMVTYNKFKTLMTGDIQEAAEKYIINNQALSEISVLKTAHHGSSTSSNEEFLNIIKPKVAIISCGINNRYHHPSQKIIERFKAFNIQTKITQQEGQIKICSDGNSFQVKGFLYN